ncbi:MAG: DUF2760 domain-containing protein [Pseudomonadota bacterium]
MSEERLGFWARLAMFFWLPWKILFNGVAALRVRQALQAPAEEAPAALPAPAPKPPERPAGAEALQLLSILQRDGRLVDFLLEDISGATDAQVGAAARIVHEGCRKALAQYVTLRPLRQESEGDPIVVPEGFDPAEIRLAGNPVGKPPYRGRLVHPGWKAVEVRLPEVVGGTDPTVVAPAEVEV